jgi:hypothetical protein
MAIIRPELIIERAAALHDQLEAEGLSLDEITLIGSSIAGLSLAMMPLDERLRHFEAHLAGMQAHGLEVDAHGRAVAREVRHG